METYKNVVKQYAKELNDITHIPVKEVEILLLHILQKNTIWLHINYNQECKITKQLETLVKKRATNYPLEYIIKKASFYGESFITHENVLIPRPQTEFLIDFAKDILENIQNPNIIEIGTGSGIISVMLALLIPNINIIAVDINDDALQLALKNAKKFNVEDKITFINSNLYNSVTNHNFDMCISNPPYIKNEYKLPNNVKYEPSNALFGGNNGDELLKDIIKNTNEHKIKHLLCEMGYDQKESMQEYLNNYKTKSIKFYKDYEKFDRGFVVEFDYE